MWGNNKKGRVIKRRREKERNREKERQTYKQTHRNTLPWNHNNIIDHSIREADDKQTDTQTYSDGQTERYIDG